MGGQVWLRSGRYEDEATKPIWSFKDLILYAEALKNSYHNITVTCHFYRENPKNQLEESFLKLEAASARGHTRWWATVAPFRCPRILQVYCYPGPMRK